MARLFNMQLVAYIFSISFFVVVNYALISDYNNMRKNLKKGLLSLKETLRLTNYAVFVGVIAVFSIMCIILMSYQYFMYIK